MPSKEAEAGLSPTGQTGMRDVRLDFFRGLALLCIFIDHTPGNILGFVTVRAYGLSDAAEMFVLIAGYTAVLAYSRAFERDGMLGGSGRIGRRLRDLYAAHLLLTVVCAILLALAAQWFENPLYYEHVNLTPYAYDPLGAIWRTLALYYQLGYLNILPLYIVLLAWFPLLWWLMQRHLGSALAASAILWLSANVLGANLPSWPELYGWYFNPFAWQLLFSIGAIAAVHTQRGGALPRMPWLVALAAAYAVFGFIVAAPWIHIDGLEGTRFIHSDSLGPNSKSRLSLWRLTHVLSMAYLVALAVPATARWLRAPAAQVLINCGRNSLDVFCVGTVLSFVGFVVMLEGGRTFEYQLAVNGLGFALMGSAAWWLSQRKGRLAVTAGQSAVAEPSVRSDEAGTR
jgi:hypothetical protein